MNCLKCNKPIPDDALYCQYCGKKQSSTAAPKPLKRANGTGSVYKLSGRRSKPWIARVAHRIQAEAGSETSQISAQTSAMKYSTIGTYATKTEALEALDHYKTRGLPELANVSVGAVRELWKANHYKNISKSAEDSYNNAWDNYMQALSSMKMSEVKTAHLQTIIDDALALGRGRAVCEKIKQLAGQLCKFAMANDIIDKNYAEMIVLPKSVKPDKDRFTDDEIDTIKKASDTDETAAVVLVLIRTGMRISELFAVKKENVYLEKRYIIGGLKTEAGINRMIPIHREISGIIARWMTEQPAADKRSDKTLLLGCIEGIQHNAHNFRERNYDELLKRLGIRPLPPHCCRHTFASVSAKNGMPPEALKAILGHEKYETTSDVYIHTDLEQLITAIDNV